MTVDVLSTIDIARPRADVASYTVDPDNATHWYANIKSVEWETARPLAVGSRIAFVATFLGRRLAYTYEVLEYADGERFVMSAAQGPFPMTTTYTFADSPLGTTVTLRNEGEPSGFGKLGAPVMTKAMSRANSKDLAKLKEILEAAR